jgi:hypothetical protein
VAVVLALLGLAAGCGLRADDEPTQIPDSDLDYRLFREGTEPPADGRWARIYVLSNQTRPPHLAFVDVRVPSAPGYERAVLQALIEWESPADQGGDRRLTTLIPTGTTLRDVRRDGDGVLTVDLANLTIEGPGQAQALAQIIYTATDIAGIDYVRFALDGKPVVVPLESRTAPAGARLSRRDFPELDPDRSPTTTALPPLPATPTTAPPSGPEGTGTTTTASAGGEGGRGLTVARAAPV